MAKEKSQSTREEIIAGLGDALDATEPYSNEILVGIYVRPERTAGGILLTDGTRKEDQWQGKVGVVLKKGRKAFKDDDAVRFDGDDVAIGDWIIYRVSDGFSLDINGIHCRMIQDIHVRGRIADPTTIY